MQALIKTNLPVSFMRVFITIFLSVYFFLISYNIFWIKANKWQLLNTYENHRICSFNIFISHKTSYKLHATLIILIEISICMIIEKYDYKKKI